MTNKISLRKLLDDNAKSSKESVDFYLNKAKRLEKERVELAKESRLTMTSSKFGIDWLKPLMFRCGFQNTIPVLPICHEYGSFLKKENETFSFSYDKQPHQIGCPVFNKSDGNTDLSKRKLEFSNMKNRVDAYYLDYAFSVTKNVKKTYIDADLIKGMSDVDKKNINESVIKNINKKESMGQTAKSSTSCNRKDFYVTTIDVLRWLADTPTPEAMEKMAGYLTENKTTKNGNYRFSELTAEVLGKFNVNHIPFNFTEDELAKYRKYYEYVAYTIKCYAVETAKRLNHRKPRDEVSLGLWLTIAKGEVPQDNIIIEVFNNNKCLAALFLDDVSETCEGSSGIYNLDWRDIAFATTYASFCLVCTHYADCLQDAKISEKTDRLDKKIANARKRYRKHQKEYNLQKQLIKEIFEDRAPEFACWRGDE